MLLLLGAETLLLVLLTVLVAGLLRSHAEILRLLEAEDDARIGSETDGFEDTDGRPPVPRRATDLVGDNLKRKPITVPIASPGRDVLLAFLSSTCSSCQEIWRGAREGLLDLPQARVVIVTKDAREEMLSRLRKLAPATGELVMSTDAWRAYGVAVAPHFIYVDGETGLVEGEGSAETVGRVLSLVEDALAEAEERMGQEVGVGA